MKVIELISQLQMLDTDMDVLIDKGREDGTFEDVSVGLHKHKLANGEIVDVLVLS